MRLSYSGMLMRTPHVLTSRDLSSDCDIVCLRHHPFLSYIVHLLTCVISRQHSAPFGLLLCRHGQWWRFGLSPACLLAQRLSGSLAHFGLSSARLLAQRLSGLSVALWLIGLLLARWLSGSSAAFWLVQRLFGLLGGSLVAKGVVARCKSARIPQFPFLLPLLHCTTYVVRTVLLFFGFADA